MKEAHIVLEHFYAPEPGCSRTKVRGVFVDWGQAKNFANQSNRSNDEEESYFELVTEDIVPDPLDHCR